MNDVKNELIRLAIDPSVPEETLTQAVLLLKGCSADNQTTDKFLSEQDAREYCGGIARSTLWHWRQQGLMSYPVGGRRLYRCSDLDAYIVKTSSTRNISF